MDTTLQLQPSQTGIPSNYIVPLRDSIHIQNQGKTRYIGQFKDGLRHGRGILYQQSNGDDSEKSSDVIVQIYRGNFSNGMVHGHGQLTVSKIPQNLLSEIPHNIQSAHILHSLGKTKVFVQVHQEGALLDQVQLKPLRKIKTKYFDGKPVFSDQDLDGF